MGGAVVTLRTTKVVIKGNAWRSADGGGCRRQQKIRDTGQSARLIRNVRVLTIEGKVASAVCRLGDVSRDVVVLDAGLELVPAADQRHVVRIVLRCGGLRRRGEP